MPPVEFIRKMRIPRITTATTTVTPTRNCDHRNCCWLGKSFLRDRRRLQAQQRLFGIWGSRATHDSRRGEMRQQGKTKQHTKATKVSPRTSVPLLRAAFVLPRVDA